MQAKDIDDAAFLDAVRQAATLRKLPDRWGGRPTVGDVASVLSGHPEDVGVAWPERDEMPEKVIRAKARKLIRRGVLDGCACGCRGDFEVVQTPAA